MPGRIPQTFIDELLERVDITEVIGRRVDLKRSGKEYAALCPFHDERTPSFTVTPQKQFYHCFGCGANGNAIGFLMEHDGLGYVDAIEELAQQVGLEVPREARRAPDRHGGLYAILAEAEALFRRRLRDSEPAVEYLKSRGITGETAKRFALGYAPAAWDTVLQALGTDPERRGLLEQAGLVAGTERGRAYDRFRDRIIFPIHDRRGRPVAFGGRALGDTEGRGQGPKYLNSPETPVFHKGRELYGLYQARQGRGRLQRLILVEGYMDVVTLVQAGIPNVVATLGTATTSEHIEALFRVVPEVVICFDGDAAGQRAAWRAVSVLMPRLREGREARFLFLPEGEDPDSLVRREGREGFEARLEGAQPLSTFFFGHLAQEVDTSSLDGRARLVALARPYLEKVPPGVYRDLLYGRLKEIAGVSDLGEAGGASAGPAAQRGPAQRRRASQERTPVRVAIAVLLQRPDLAEQITDPDRLARLDVRGVGLLTELLELLHTKPNLTVGGVLEHWRDREEARYLGKLAGRLEPGEDEALGEVLSDAVQRIMEQGLQQRINALHGKQKAGALSEDERRELWECQREREAVRAYFAQRSQRTP